MMQYPVLTQLSCFVMSTAIDRFADMMKNAIDTVVPSGQAAL